MKKLLDLLVSISKAWPIIVSVLLVILAAIVRFSKFAGQSITLSLPLWILILIIAFALYPLCKMAQFVASRKKAPLKPLNGLLWKTPVFGLPIAICPREGCGCEVICKKIPPPPFHIVTGNDDLRTEKFRYSYQYECPVHGTLSEIPNESINSLQKNVKLAFK